MAKQRPKFFEENGNLHFNYCGDRFTVPKKIINRGKQVICDYVKKIIEKQKSRHKDLRIRRNRKGQNINISVSVQCDQITLCGRIVSIIDGVVNVRLESPANYGGEASFDYHNFGAGMAGMHVWGKGLTLSKHVIPSARKTLVRIYEAKARKPVRDLVRDLN